MVKVREDLTGRQFGRLTVTRQAEDYVGPSGKHLPKWRCECSCSEHNIIEVLGENLKKGYTTSCGCYQKEKTSEANKKVSQWLPEVYEDEYGKYRIGIVSNGDEKIYVDIDNYDKVKDLCWSKSIYKTLLTVVTTINNKTIKMHRFLGFKNYDHIDHNELNNRKYNLRPCTHQGNMRNRKLQRNNTSEIIGISFDKRRTKWHSYIQSNNQHIFLGYFTNKNDAIKVRLQAERDYFGEFAPQQHLFEQYGIEPLTKQSD